MVKFDTIIGQDQPVRILNTLIETKSVPHALLFTGLTGVGKLATSNAFALTCNCTRQNKTKRTNISETKHPPREKLSPAALPSCGDCSSCSKILAGNHPDIIYVKPAGRNIKIAQIRDLIDTLTMKPYEARLRVVVISEAHLLNLSAGNALLKILEEPPDQTVLILTTTQRSDVLPTIASRCQVIRFMPLSRDQIEAELNNNHGVPHLSARVLSYMADGSMIRALELHNRRWLRHRNWLLSATGFDKLDKIDTLPINVLFAVVEKLLSQKAQLAISLETMMGWLRDIIVCRYKPDHVINADLIDKLKKVSQKIPETTILKKMEVISTAQKDIEANANLRLVMELMMLRLRGGDY